MSGYPDLYEKNYVKLFLRKLGLNFDENSFKDDAKFVDTLLGILYSTKADFTQSFRDLSEISFHDLLENRDRLCSAVHWGLAELRKSEKIDNFLSEYSSRLKKEFGQNFDEERLTRMQAANPRYILRNWIAQQVRVCFERGSEQCDHMTRLFGQYLAIYNSENWTICIKELPKWVHNFAKH